MKCLLISVWSQALLQEAEKTFEAGDWRFKFMTRHADEFIFSLLQRFAIGDVAYATLNHFMTICLVQRTYELYVPMVFVFGPERQRLAAEKMMLLQFPQDRQVGFPILKQTN